MPTQGRTGLAYDSHHVIWVLILPLPPLVGRAQVSLSTVSSSVEWGKRGLRRELQDLLQRVP